MKAVYTLIIIFNLSVVFGQTETEVAQTKTLQKVLKKLKNQDFEKFTDYMNSDVIEKTDLNKLSNKIREAMSGLESINVIYLSGKNIFRCQYLKDGKKVFEVKFYFNMYDAESKVTDIRFE
ncbi:MAG: hypothetical protein KDC84_00960 [Crocinitomicaceae bacterium]|nr:hypothetical protein [Crocinitomicaceae bacterium]